MPYAGLIPMPTIAAILFMVAYNMCQWRTFVDLVKTAPKSDVIVLLTTFFLTVLFDLVVAIEIGMIFSHVNEQPMHDLSTIMSHMVDNCFFAC